MPPRWQLVMHSHASDYLHHGSPFLTFPLTFGLLVFLHCAYKARKAKPSNGAGLRPIFVCSPHFWHIYKESE